MVPVGFGRPGATLTVTLKLWVTDPDAFCARTVTGAAATSAVVGIETTPVAASIVTPAGAAASP